MKLLRNYSRVVLILLNIPFAFTNATKQRMRKKMKFILSGLL